MNNNHESYTSNKVQFTLRVGSGVNYYQNHIVIMSGGGVTVDGNAYDTDYSKEQDIWGNGGKAVITQVIWD